MKCLETERLISYAYHLTDELAASQVRAHLGECSRCREIVEQHGRLGALLDEWKATEPTPWFDARVRQAVGASQARRKPGGFWGREWARGLALASLGVLIIAGMHWFTQVHPWASKPSGIATRQPQQVRDPRTTAQTAELRSPIVVPRAGLKPVPAVPGFKSADASSNEDNDAQALEDYDLAANFDLLSELPKGEPRVAN
jgi:hypothetical protein